jgi:acetylornithine deacetylase/succinyl-diaminopimelate desuccinylase-like protein
MSMEKAIAHGRVHQAQAVDVLKELIRIPSISTYSENAEDMRRAAEWIANRLRGLGARVEVYPAIKHPVVYAEIFEAGPQAPTVLVYGHYDVQPIEPLGEWHSPPFEPTQRGDYLFGRGASDMKGQLIAQLASVEAVRAAGKLPVNLKYLLEGEEEVGSPNLRTFLLEHRDLVKCDVVLNVDAMILRPDLPSVVYGLRGLAYFEVRLFGPKQDLHSGLFGGAIHNPAQVLCELIAGMKDAQGHVTLPGFYDSVRPILPDERAALARVPQTDDEVKRQAGVSELRGEAGYSTIEQLGARPTLEVNGLLSGFTGEGSKTVLPARAMAKISMRLVPDQTPERVQAQLEEYLRRNAPSTVRWEVQNLAGATPAIVRRDTHEMGAAVRALKDTFGVDPVFVREGGTIAVVGILQELTGHESILMGFGLPDDNLHSPNERLFLPNFYRGIESYTRFLYALVN